MKDVVIAEICLFKVLLCAERGEQYLGIYFELCGHILYFV